MTTATMSKTSQRAVKVVVKPATGKPVTYRFENQGCNSRAAKWMQKNHPLAVAIDETTAELTDGSTLKVERGATVADLYPLTPAAETKTQSVAKAITTQAPPVVEVVEQPAEEPAKGGKKPAKKPAKKPGRKK